MAATIEFRPEDEWYGDYFVVQFEPEGIVALVSADGPEDRMAKRLAEQISELRP